jgi:hypothetical protein
LMSSHHTRKEGFNYLTKGVGILTVVGEMYAF